jgi:hypothetical protein
MALESDQIPADIVESTELPEVVHGYEVRGVPCTAVNGKCFIDGPVPKGEFVERVIAALATPERNRSSRLGHRLTSRARDANVPQAERRSARSASPNHSREGWFAARTETTSILSTNRR